MTSRPARRAGVAGVALALVAVLAACGGGSSAGSDGTEPAAAGDDLGLLTDGTLTVGMNLQFPPEMYLDEDDEPAGYDVDLLNALADELGLELEIQNLDFNGLIPGLQSKQFDMVSVGLTATDERKEVVDFSRAYVPYTTVLAVPDGDDADATVEDFDTSGTVITALQGSSGEQLATDTFPQATISGFPDQNAALLEVATGRAQGSVVEDYILAQYIKANPGQVQKAELPEPLALGYGSWAVQKGNTGLVTVLDTFLCEQQSSGGLASFYEKNFEVPAADFPEMPSGC
ncbi:MULTISPECIES: ABC transporter substrate-binding protein [unclassified Cellulomonas]|uniref:substrate-binding periplasmic protein n=1 Tax=unclassified Cellulomonas TaxID=2620175 RepID=UPI0019CC8274|nr:ABC transporter substrate-binding protein [Cellulomonas sp. ES6]MBD3779293.1 amino acid ABC transporter substrate-binding protein [Micrococcales bacterium]WHP16044.1 ABC transporter substrate-binding protein [Cellulomonas sp. ES6]